MWVRLAYLFHQKDNLRQKFEDAQLPSLWKDIIKETHPQARFYSEYQELKNNTLFIKVHDPLWVSELELCKEKLKTELNKKRNQQIKTIKFII